MDDFIPIHHFETLFIELLIVLEYMCFLLNLELQLFDRLGIPVFLFFDFLVYDFQDRLGSIHFFLQYFKSTLFLIEFLELRLTYLYFWIFSWGTFDVQSAL